MRMLPNTAIATVRSVVPLLKAALLLKARTREYHHCRCLSIRPMLATRAQVIEQDVGTPHHSAQVFISRDFRFDIFVCAEVGAVAPFVPQGKRTEMPP